MAAAIAAFLFWKENRNSRVGIASYIGGLLTTVTAGAIVGMAVAAMYLAVLMLYMIAGGTRETVELGILMLGSGMAVHHVYVQAEKNGRERVAFACRMQEEWTKSITKAIAAENPTAAEEAANEVRELYRECHIAMNNDASMLLSRTMEETAWLKTPGRNSDQRNQIKASLVRLIVPSMPMGTSDPVTTVILEVFRAYRQGGLSGWHNTRRVSHLAEQEGPGMRFVNSGLVEHEETVLGHKD